jgi:hypothetical protein
MQKKFKDCIKVLTLGDISKRTAIRWRENIRPKQSLSQIYNNQIKTSIYPSLQTPSLSPRAYLKSTHDGTLYSLIKDFEKSQNRYYP